MQTEFRSRSRSVIDVKRRILHKRQNLDERVVSPLDSMHVGESISSLPPPSPLSPPPSLPPENACLQKDNGSSHLPCVR